MIDSEIILIFHTAHCSKLCTAQYFGKEKKIELVFFNSKIWISYGKSKELLWLQASYIP